MHTFDEVAGYLDDIVDALPGYIPQSLPGGIFLIPEAKPHPSLPFPQYMVLGEYPGSAGGAYPRILQFCHGKIRRCERKGHPGGAQRGYPP